MKNKRKGMGHLRLSERNQIEILLGRGCKQKEIADVLGKHASTISREVRLKSRRKRARGGTIVGRYEAKVAQQKSDNKRRNSKYQCMKIEENHRIREYVIEHLKLHWSPEQIQGRLKRKGYIISFKTIYTWLYKGTGQRYCKYLLSKRYSCKRRKKKKTKRTLIPNRIGIEQRDESINNGKEYGHYEGDTIVSGKNGKGSLAVIQERKSRYFDMRLIDNMKPDSFNKATSSILDTVDAKSLTLDNGIENTRHDKLGVDIYFCNPYSSWEKGSIENLNRMIRWFVPKGSDISKFSKKYIKNVVDIINNKPRKILGFKTPLEVATENDLFK